ncbi:MULTISPECIES: alpha/beta hydrolase [unclassified Amycolatopsis]|uniref:alpha/beta hydrolase n=1 Tax=unclassified Amycolatopsis TaxID=2618356 RepID=UPI001C6A6B84|nr:alpha/beta hydrolase [Amycolatopsis sp. DSM 110486]QYN18793.1 alpha/beta hydrolase [Amycolatopsis sp. DSM 110486]
MVETRYADLDEVRLSYRTMGEGPELVVLLHGWPQTGLCWRHVLPALAERYTVVVPDLRGYGSSGLAATGYDKRATAADLHQLIVHLGHGSALVAGHDRGARVAHRWALDHPGDVRRLALLDILPTREVMTTYDRRSATAMWHWFFHLQPELPELLLAGNVEPYLNFFFRRPRASGAIDDETFEEYVSAFSEPGHLRASLEDYRAGFGVDLDLDERDHTDGNVLGQPLLLLWGGDGGLRDKDVLGVWRQYATDVRGTAVAECGHYVPEEQPAVVAAELLAFFGERD